MLPRRQDWRQGRRQLGQYGIMDGSMCSANCGAFVCSECKAETSIVMFAHDCDGPRATSLSDMRSYQQHMAVWHGECIGYSRPKRPADDYEGEREIRRPRDDPSSAPGHADWWLLDVEIARYDAHPSVHQRP